MEQLLSGAKATPIDVNVNNFMAEVIEGSSTMPVIVQFWAPWCNPCKQLAPTLEKVVSNKAGKVKLVRINIDENQQIAQQMRVQSVPTVYGFVDGQPVDGFSGAQPESAVSQFVEKLASMGGAGADLAESLSAGESALVTQDFDTAMGHFQKVMSVEPESVPALAGVVRCLTGLGDLAGAREIIDQLNDEFRDHDAMQVAIAALDLIEKASVSASEIDSARAAVEADGNDLEARQKLAMALYATGKHAEAMDQLLVSIQTDRSWNDEGARKQLLEFFTSLGSANPDVIKARRRLSTVLFA